MLLSHIYLEQMSHQIPHIQISSYAAMRKYINVHVSYKLTAINNVPGMVNIHLTLLAYAPQQVSLQYCSHMFHCTYYCSVHIDPQ